LKRHEAFAWDDDTLGRTTVLEHSVPTGDHPPIQQYQYPIPSIAKEPMREQVNDMIKKNIVRDSTSSWCSPVLLIKKLLPDGTIKYRFCIDLRKVNEVTAKDCYAIPRIDETVDALCGSSFFSSMDVDRAFWQIAMAEQDKHKFAFRVDGRLLEPNVMPFGSKNAPSTFQRLMDKVLRGLTWKQCLVYIDDVLVFARSFEEHCERLDAVLGRIQDAGLKLKPGKCEFGTSEVNYLGFQVSDKGVRPSPRKVAYLLATEPPKSTKVLHSFMCSINYYRTLIPCYSRLTANLLAMSNSKSKMVVWSDSSLADFLNLKKALANAPILAFPDFGKTFVLQCDASKDSIGGVLLQLHMVNGRRILKPVMFFGRKLTATEQRYSTTEREMLAIIYGYQSCYHFVYGRKIVFGTDHKPLVTLCKLKRPFDRLGRLLNHLMGVDYTLEFIPGHLNYLADFMSRAVVQDTRPMPIASAGVNTTNLESEVDWAHEQSLDKELCGIIACIKSHLADSEWLKVANGQRWLRERKYLYVYGEILYHGSSHVVVPLALIADILYWFHDSPFAGHRAFGSTLYALSCRYFWLRMFSGVKEYCQSCVKCQAFNYSNSSGKAPLQSIVTSRPGQFVQLDYMGPFKVSKSGNKYICLAVDAHIKFLWYAATKTIDEVSTAIFLFNEIVCKVGPIEKVMSDQGGCFEGNVFKHLCKLIGSDKLRSSAFHPSGNGGIEIVNKVIKPTLAKFVSSSHDDWDLHLGLAVNSYNNTVQSSIGMAPSEALFNRPPVLMADVICNNRLPSNTNVDNVGEHTLLLWKNAQRIRHEISFNKEVAQDKQKLNYDRSLKDNRLFEVGHFVKIKNFKKPSNSCAAFVPKFIGPFKIVKKLSELSYEIEATGVKNQVVHYNRLLPYFARESVESPKISLALKDSTVQVEERGYLYNNLNNLTSAVFLYRRKLRRTEARVLLEAAQSNFETETFEALSLSSDRDNSLDSLVNSAEEVVERLNIVTDIPLGEAGAIQESALQPVLVNVRSVTELEWQALERLAIEIRVNDKGKRQALCWQCEFWFEEKIGLRIHKAKCVGAMPVRSLIPLSPSSNLAPRLNSMAEQEHLSNLVQTLQAVDDGQEGALVPPSLIGGGGM
jgi:hypothetical protein